jgi:hypothetical protein
LRAAVRAASFLRPQLPPNGESESPGPRGLVASTEGASWAPLCPSSSVRARPPRNLPRRWAPELAERLSRRRQPPPASPRACRRSWPSLGPKPRSFKGAREGPLGCCRGVDRWEWLYRHAAFIPSRKDPLSSELGSQPGLGRTSTGERDHLGTHGDAVFALLDPTARAAAGLPVGGWGVSGGAAAGRMLRLSAGAHGLQGLLHLGSLALTSTHAAAALCHLQAGEAEARPRGDSGRHDRCGVRLMGRGTSALMLCIGLMPALRRFSACILHLAACLVAYACRRTWPEPVTWAVVLLLHGLDSLANLAYCCGW